MRNDSPWLLLVSSTSPRFFSSTRGDEYDLCPSCSVCSNRGTACVLLRRVLPCLFQWFCRSCFSFSVNSSSVIASSPPAKHFNSCSSRLSLPPPLHLALCYRFVCDTRDTHCPCQLKTGPVSSRHTQMSMVYTPLFTSSLMTVPS